MYYIVSIVIYSTNQKEHDDCGCNVLQTLLDFCLRCKAGQCQLGVSEKGFFGLIINYG
jgi:hypothetical protein